ncbi:MULTISPECIES: hydroxyphenylacetyl-CoA thioesterase PaaI [Paracoccaceae]|jgi:acyl-CoA thioesterase|uniref:hydroxyphenylacetyl-CoA thioesterase PaaI n=1 Tax=Rhodobacterales TaxID=204455 RepID=UPI001B054380|nr:hydroxyphenylacetyl-CoA thioesterase PaaI [Boseongicola sp. H5]MBO6604613.1 hydroxyphenylacetyl-CoA thioesterase PaaI [Roseicyclus sp.]MBO6626044.1 hydroxyphenylacetyl-CoA thioesterase PaaI [Roseicyclus sp.]MBO6923434.1 hydroxyphenylacetyl-CoA thioesterase PaaI [Roseicyclus sp.]
MTPEERARRSAEAMWAGDAASKWVGMHLVEVAPGYAQMTCTVRAEHLNGHRICHGGVIFSLADSAFAFACNSHNQIAVAQHNTISYLSPGQPGETLTAEAREISRQGRNGITDVVVTGGDGRQVALFRGASRTISGTHFKEEA